MAKQLEGKPPPPQQQQRRPARASVPAFGGWEGGAAPDYSVDFTKIRAARMMQRQRKALSWSSFVGNATAAAPGAAADDDDEEEDNKHQEWSSAASESDDDRGRRRRHRPRHRRVRSDAGVDRDDREPIRPGRAPPKGKDKLKGYLFGCVGGLW